MDPKVYICFFMVLLSIVLADYLKAYKFGDSGTIVGESDSYLPAYRFGPTGQTVRHIANFLSTNKKKPKGSNTSNKSSKKSRKSKLRKRKVRTTANSDTGNIKIYETDEKIRKGDRDVRIRHRDRRSKTVESSESIINEQTDNTDTENNAQETSIAPTTEKKIGKKYRPEFKYIKINDRKVKRYNSDIPDNAEAILKDSHEVNMTVMSGKVQQENHKNGTEYILEYDIVEGKNSSDEEKSKESQENNNLETKNIEIKDNPAVSGRKKYQPMFQFSRLEKKHFSNDYSEIIDSIEVDDITTTPFPETTTYGKTEIIYLTPNPDGKKYKPEFKYYEVKNEPYNYDMPHNHSEDKDKSHSSIKKDASENSENESTEPNYIRKIKATLENKENSYENSADEETDEEKSKEIRDSYHDKISRKVRERDRPTFENVDQYYNKILNEKIKQQEIIEEPENTEVYERKEQETMGKQRPQRKKPLTRNYAKKKSLLKPNETHKKVTSKDTNGHSKIFHTEIGSYNTTHFSHHSRATVKKSKQSRKKVTLSNKRKERNRPVLQNKKHSNKIREKLFGTTTKHDVAAAPITFKEDNMGYQPDMEYSKHYNQIRERMFKKKLTPKKILPSSEMEKSHKTVPEDFERKRTTTQDETLGDVYAEKQIVTEKSRDVYAEKQIVSEKLGDVYAEKQIASEKLGDVYAEKQIASEKLGDVYEDRQTVPEQKTEKVTTIIYKEDNMAYNPEMEYSKQYSNIRERLFGKRSTPVEVKLFHPPEQKKNYKAFLSDLQRKRTRPQHETLGDVYGDRSTVLEKILEKSTTDMSATDIIRERFAPVVNYTRRDHNEPEYYFYTKRSTNQHKVTAVKIKKAKHVEKTTTQSEEITTISDYGDTSVDQKETENTPLYQVHENIVDIPDDRLIPRPVNGEYVLVPDRYVPIPTRSHGIFSPFINDTNYDPEHPIVNIVQGMKEYFTVVGKGLYNTVKDIFNEKLS